MSMRMIAEGELREIIAKHRAWINDAGGELANLSYADLRNANLRYADLSYANLSYANLSYANLSYADLSYADLSYADLSYADLSYANLRYADLSYADLRYADLSYADLRNVDLSYANLILVGQDILGHLFWSFANDDGVVVLRVGCREFVGISVARSHWMARHERELILREDRLSLVDRCERMALARGWKLNPAD